jgi:hypothetical protein
MYARRSPMDMIQIRFILRRSNGNVPLKDQRQADNR